MRKVIAQLLILSFLFAGIAWAVNAYAANFVEHEYQLTHDFGAQPDGPANIKSCDHFCHAAAHFLGLSSAPFVLPLDAGSRRIALSLPPAHASAQKPPLRPPRA